MFLHTNRDYFFAKCNILGQLSTVRNGPYGTLHLSGEEKGIENSYSLSQNNKYCQ